MTPSTTSDPDLIRAAFEWVAGFAWLAWIVGPVLFVAVAWWYFREGSARGVSRRSRASSKKAAGALGIFGVGVVGALAGFGEGVAAALAGIGGVLAPHAGFLGQLGITTAGYYGMRGSFIDSATTFLAFALLLIVISVIWGE